MLSSSKLTKMVVVAFSAAIIFGCSTRPNEGAINSIHKHDEKDLVYTDASVRTINSAVNSFTCMTPSPDAILERSVSDNLSLSLVNIGSDENNQFENKISATELSGRSAGVVFSRDLLHSFCEFSRNFKLTKTESIPLFMELAAKVSEVMKTDLENQKINPHDIITPAVIESISEATISKLKAEMAAPDS